MGPDYTKAFHPFHTGLGCPRSWLAAKALACLGDRLAYLLPRRPPRTRGTPPLAFKVCLDAMTTVVLDGLP